MRLEDEEYKERLERIKYELNDLENYDSEPNEFLAIDAVLKEFEKLESVVSQTRNIKLRS